MTLDCPGCGGYLFTQGHHEGLVCLDTKCRLYGELQPDVDAGQLRVDSSEPDGDNEYDDF